MAKAKPIFKIVFLNHGKIYELFASAVVASDIYGFVQVHDLIFETGETLVVDPTEERLREEFEGVRSLHLPMHSVVRIEEVANRGLCKIRDPETGEKVTPFPLTGMKRSPES